METALPVAPTRWQDLRCAIVLSCIGFVVFSLFSWDRILKQSTDPHFVYQAHAFLRGSLELDRKPPHDNDWASFLEIRHRDGKTYRGIYRTSGAGGAARQFKTLDGPVILLQPDDVISTRTRYFVSFPPFPALLMTPLVALFGLGFNDVLFTLVIAGANVGLVFLVLRRLAAIGWSARKVREDVFLTLLFAFGTVNFWCSVLGQVWFTALVVGVTTTCLYVLAVLADLPLLAGLALACGLATRPHLAFAAVFFLLPLVLPWGRPAPAGWRPRLRSLALFSLPVLVTGALLAAMNTARFGTPFEFGHSFLASGTIPRIKDHGLFDPHFLSVNLTAALTLLPEFRPTPPYLQLSKHGMSLLLTTPVFAVLLWPLRRPLPHRLLWLTVAAVAIPELFYQNTGYEQFGYRFSLDYTVYLVMLLAIGGRPITWRFAVLAGFGVLVNGFGAVTFKRFPGLYVDRFLEI